MKTLDVASTKPSTRKRTSIKTASKVSRVSSKAKEKSYRPRTERKVDATLTKTNKGLGSLSCAKPDQTPAKRANQDIPKPNDVSPIIEDDHEQTIQGETKRTLIKEFEGHSPAKSLRKGKFSKLTHR